jgi:hypothetical protein
MSQIFYSAVDENLQEELTARAAAATSRTTDSLNYMLTKIANVELVAYKNQDFKDRGEKNQLYTLGGKTVQSGNYLPTGFLSNKNIVNGRPNSYKVPPFITSCAVTMNDHTMGTLNSATINITIPDPGRDLDYMESIFAKPGRALTIKIAHADSAVITKKTLAASTIQPKVPLGSTNTKLCVVEFDALVISFSISYLTDGTVALTIHTRGTSNVYTDVTMLTNPAETVDKEKKDQLTSDFYKRVYDEVVTYLANIDDSTVEIHRAYEYLPTPLQNELEGELDTWMFRSSQFWDKQERYYIQLGVLIKYLNRFILTKQKEFVPGAFIISNDSYCSSNYYEHLVSADPENIFILDQCIYGQDPTDKKDRNFISLKTKFTSEGGNIYDSKFNNTEGEAYSYPTRLYINMDLIKDILINSKTSETKTLKVGEFLTELSKRINYALGGAIDMKLISHPDNPNYLLYYDANYLGNKKDIKPYNVPMMAGKERGTIVRDFKIEAKLPTSMQGLMYTTANSDNISEEQIAPYMNFMYNNADVIRTTDATGKVTDNTDNNKLIENRKSGVLSEMEKKYKESHEKYLNALIKAKQEFGDVKKNESKQTQLVGALKKYIQYPTPSIKQSAQMQAPIYPYDIEFTIDGINGFRYGDALEFDAIPTKYKNGTTFSIIAVNHNVSTNGEWTTNIKCIMRPKFDQ